MDRQPVYSAKISYNYRKLKARTAEDTETQDEDSESYFEESETEVYEIFSPQTPSSTQFIGKHESTVHPESTIKRSRNLLQSRNNLQSQQSRHNYQKNQENHQERRILTPIYILESRERLASPVDPDCLIDISNGVIDPIVIESEDIRAGCPPRKKFKYDDILYDNDSETEIVTILPRNSIKTAPPEIISTYKSSNQGGDDTYTVKTVESSQSHFNIPFAFDLNQVVKPCQMYKVYNYQTEFQNPNLKFAKIPAAVVLDQNQNHRIIPKSMEKFEKITQNVQVQTHLVEMKDFEVQVNLDFNQKKNSIKVIQPPIQHFQNVPNQAFYFKSTPISMSKFRNPSTPAEVDGESDDYETIDEYSDDEEPRYHQYRAKARVSLKKRILRAQKRAEEMRTNPQNNEKPSENMKPNPNEAPIKTPEIVMKQHSKYSLIKESPVKVQVQKSVQDFSKISVEDSSISLKKYDADGLSIVSIEEIVKPKIVTNISSILSSRCPSPGEMAGEMEKILMSRIDQISNSYHNYNVHRDASIDNCFVRKNKSQQEVLDSDANENYYTKSDAYLDDDGESCSEIDVDILHLGINGNISSNMSQFQSQSPLRKIRSKSKANNSSIFQSESEIQDQTPSKMTSRKTSKKSFLSIVQPKMSPKSMASSLDAFNEKVLIRGSSSWLTLGSKSQTSSNKPSKMRLRPYPYTYSSTNQRVRGNKWSSRDFSRSTMGQVQSQNQSKNKNNFLVIDQRHRQGLSFWQRLKRFFHFPYTMSSSKVRAVSSYSSASHSSSYTTIDSYTYTIKKGLFARLKAWWSGRGRDGRGDQKSQIKRKTSSQMYSSHRDSLDLLRNKKRKFLSDLNQFNEDTKASSSGVLRDRAKNLKKLTSTADQGQRVDHKKLVNFSDFDVYFLKNKRK